MVYTGFINSINFQGKYHFHSLYEMHIPLIDTLHILVEDMDVVLNPGEVCIIPPGITHYVFQNDVSRRTGLRFTFTQGDNIFSETYGMLSGTTLIKNCDIYNKYISRAIENFKADMPEFTVSDLIYIAIYEIALRISGKNCDKPKKETPYSDIIISEKIEDFFNENYNKKITLDDLAKHLNLGKRQTERVTLKLFNSTFSPLLNKKRLSTAKFLLKTTDMSVDKIASISGFEDKSYFYRKFSAAYNTTPVKYRKEAQTLLQETNHKKHNNIFE